MAFFYISGRQVPPQFAIGPELRAFQNGDGYAWFVQHVVEGGAAHEAGIRLGDAVLAVNGRKPSPPNEPRFQLGESHDVLVQKKSEADTRTIKLHVPHATEKDRPPMVSHDPSPTKFIQQRIGVIRVAAFPSAAGFEFALRLDQIITHLKAEGCERLIVDMRGNPGGGLGSLRLMSYLVRDRRPTGYSLTRKGKDRGKTLNNLTPTGRIPVRRSGFGQWHSDLACCIAIAP
jgi:C-terminal processing protease CtpA/Prc